MYFDLSSSKVNSIDKSDIQYLKELLLDEKGNLRVLPFNDLKNVPQPHLSQFCTEHGFYSIPTKELIDFLREEIGERIEKTIEIGSGNGAISRELKIKGTDSYMQKNDGMRKLYEAYEQATVPYGEHVERLDGIEAVRKYRPQVVIAAWVTHKYSSFQHTRGGNKFGVKEEKILEKVQTYIHIGNESTHDKKPITSIEHRRIKEPWILSRSLETDKNVIYIWDK